MGTHRKCSNTGGGSSKLPGHSREILKPGSHSLVGGAVDDGPDDAGDMGRGDQKGTDDSVIRASVRTRA